MAKLDNGTSAQLFALARLWPDTLAGRMIAVLMVSLGLLHVFSICAYYAGTAAIFESSRTRELAGRLLSMERALDVAALEQRDAAAHALSGEGFVVHWDRTSLLPGGPQSDWRLAKLRDELIQIHPEFERLELRLSLHQADSGEPRSFVSSWHPLLVSLTLSDGSWVSIVAASPQIYQLDWLALLFSTTAMAVGILIVSMLLVRSLLAPWKAFTQAADHASIDTTGQGIDERGPREIRRAARAFNNMLTRIRMLVSERAYTLAAISHDLRTPLTRQRLRLELIDDTDLRDKMQRDLDEMEAMVNSSLVYLRGDDPNEEQRAIDLTALLESICSDLSDAGREVQLHAHPGIVVLGRPLALKRALTNVLDNAVKYGKRAHVSMNTEANRAVVLIDDEGPGIPADQQERVFEPFYRIEGSRGRETGGTGLGLTVARTLMRANGGDIRLNERPGGGLRVEVTIPTTPQRENDTKHGNDSGA